jgi:tryptophanyl-tRNA synthetase
MKVLFSGSQPSGALHLGNVRNRVALLDLCFCCSCIARHHALAERCERAEQQARGFGAGVDLRACDLSTDVHRKLGSWQ